MGGDSRYSTMLSTTLPTLGGINSHKQALKRITDAKGKKKFSYLTPDAGVQGSSLALRVVSLDKKLYSTLSLFTQLYKWVPVTYCWGVNMETTSIPSRRGLAILLGVASCLSLVCAFTFTMNSSRWTQIIINKQDLFKTYNLRIQIGLKLPL